MQQPSVDPDAAEQSLLTTLEERRGRVQTASGEVYRTAVAGERPLLAARVGLEEMYSLYNGTESSNDDREDEATDKPSPSPRQRFKNIALKVIRRNSQKDITASSAGQAKEPTTTKTHKRSQTLQAVLESFDDDIVDAGSNKATAFFETVGGESPELGTSQFAVEETQVDRLVRDALKVEQLLEQKDDDTAATDEQSLPLLGSTIPDEIHMYGSTVARRVQEHRANRRRRKWYRKLVRCCNPLRFFLLLQKMVSHMQLTAFAMVLFTLALVCFYCLGNPHFDFFPGPATLSWWCNFIGRQLLTLQLAQATQYLLVDGLVLGSNYTVQLLGPLLTLWALQAKGRPLLLMLWSAWDLLLLHGDDKFQMHWLYWTGIAIYSRANSGSYILSSSIYFRFLLSLLLAGFLTSVKCVAIAVYFGRRTFSEFKPRLEKILKDIVLLNEVADLAEEAERITSEGDGTALQPKAHNKRASRALGAQVSWADDDSKLGLEDPETSSALENDDDSISEPSRRKSTLSRNESGSFRIKDLLDRWKEPINKLEKTTDASISDILRFRRALAFMDEDCPFGDSFGNAKTRDECIESAHGVYMRLIKLTPDSSILSNDVFAMLAQEDDGTINTNKRGALRRLFRPDRMNQIPILAFIQSVDTLYRKLLYFRASVGNASVIDHVLEQMIDAAFAFVLFLIILSVMNINFWPLLVSLSTLVVSLSFAMGSSASKYIEGVLLISARRPFDLGDRIVLTSADLVENPGAGNSWLVEDINLYATTLRYALTNEVATVPNGTIAGSRIVNLNRSQNAICTKDLKMHLSIIENSKIDVYRASIEKFVADNPRVWESLVVFRFTEFDSDNESCGIRLSVRHRNSWQDTPRVMRDWGEFQRFLFKLGDTMGVDFDSPPQRRLLYQGGALMSGKVDHYKRDLLNARNIKSSEGEMEDSSEPLNGPRSYDQDVSDTLFLAQLQQSNT